MQTDHLQNDLASDHQLTLLFAANGKRLAKRFRADGTKDSYDSAFEFVSTEADIATIDELLNIILYVSQSPERQICVIRGARRSDIHDNALHRRTLQNYRDVPRAWALLDIDDLLLPDAINPTSQAAVEYAISKLPPCFQDRACVYHFSSSAGLAGQHFKGHLAFLLEEAVDSWTLRHWAQDYVNRAPELANIDPSPFNAVQIHYLADPVFDDPSMDPFLGRARVGLIRGTHRRVPVASIVNPPLAVVPAEFPERIVARDRTPKAVGTSWQPALDDIADDRLGCHGGILQVIKCALKECGAAVDRGAVKHAIRERVALAVEEGALIRPPDYLADETSDLSLERIFDWGVEHGYGLQFIRRSNNPKFSQALLDLEAAAKGEASKHSVEDLAFTAAGIGLYQCPARMSLNDMLAGVQRAACGQLSQTTWQVIDQRSRERYAHLVRTTLSTRKITRHERIEIQSLDEIDSTKPGVHLVKAPMGSGKTERVAGRVVEQANRLACVLNHRISLSADLANRLNLDNYKEETFEGDRGVAACVNSILKASVETALDRAPALIIDEFSQTIDHLAVGPLERRAAVYRRFWELIRQKEIVVLLDADLNDRDIDLVTEAVKSEKPVSVYEMPESWADHTFRILPAKADLVMSVCEDLKQGEKVMVALDSLTGTKRLAAEVREEIKAHDPALAESLRILTIHSENSGGDEQEAFLRNPDAESVNYDLVLYSPSISSGVSLKDGHFTKVYGIYNGTVPGREFFQMLRRNRTVKMLTVAAQPVGRKSRVESAESRMRGYLDLAGDMGLDPLEDDDVSYLNATVTYQQEVQQQNAFNRLVVLAEDMGYQIVREAAQTDIELADCEFDPMLREQIKAAKNLSEIEYERLKRKHLKTQDQSYRLTRYHIQRALGLGEESPSDEDFDYIKEFGRGAPRQFELLRSNEEENRELMHKVPRAELWSHTETRKHRLKLLEILGVDPVDFTGEFGREALQNAMSYLIEHSAKLNRLKIASTIVPVERNGAVDVPATLEAHKPKAAMNQYFKSLGLSLDVTGTSAEYRKYSVSQDSVDCTMRYVAARGNIKLMPNANANQNVQGLPRSLRNLPVFPGPDGLQRCAEMREAAEGVLGKKGPALINLLANQTVPLSTDWIRQNQGISDPKTIRQWSSAWGSITFPELYRYEYKPEGIRGAGGRKQIALSLEADPDIVRDHLEKVLSCRITDVRAVPVPANATYLEKLPENIGRPPRLREEALAA